MVTFSLLSFLKMNKLIYSGCFAGQPLLFDFRYAGTAFYFGIFLNSAEQSDERSVCETVKVSDKAFDEWNQDWQAPHNAFTEYSLSIYPVTDHLLKYGACAFHSAAFLWRGKAWLFTADSGVGKSTQLRNLVSLYDDEVKIMNGDKPLLKLEESGGISVFPSPWRGKENWGNDQLTATLGGVILLKQGKENNIKRVQPLDCTAMLISQVFSLFEKEESVHSACRIIETMLETVPVWKLTNLGDLDSTRMVYNTLLAQERGSE